MLPAFAAVLALALLVPVAVMLDLQISAAGPARGCARSSGQDALWMGHAWVDGRRTSEDIRNLGLGLASTGVRDVFVHVGPLEDDGTLDSQRRPQAAALLSELRAAAPRLRVQAWIGNVLGDGGLTLADVSTRDAVVAASLDLVAEGWDGVHLNVEPIASGDSAYLTLLDDLGVIRDSDTVLSVAAEPLELRSGLARATDAVRDPLWWTGSYLSQVAQRVDQVAVMAYDTGLPTEALYTGMLVRQTHQALAAVPDDVDLLIGAPAFHTDNLGHREHAETVRAAALGTRIAVNRERECDRDVGLALYVDFDATDQDWIWYCEHWVGRPGAGRNTCQA